MATTKTAKMKPVFQHIGVVILQGDVRTVLKEMKKNPYTPASPRPYWGLRDYGVKGQLELEDTPEVYLESMVEVFRDISSVRPFAFGTIAYKKGI